MDLKKYLQPDWPAPTSVRAFCTTRQGGVSLAPYDSFNLGTRVGDDINAVSANRRQLQDDLKLPNPPFWIHQVHGTLALDAALTYDSLEADASFTRETQRVCTILTADCLPLLVCNRAGTEVAAIHAGWRGLLAGVIENTLQQLSTAPTDLLVWLGPAIGAAVYEISAEIRTDFLARDPGAIAAFQARGNDKYLMDLYLLARRRLARIGVNAVYGGEWCAYSDSDLFFSFRRDNGVTGRMASLIWLE